MDEQKLSIRQRLARSVLPMAALLPCFFAFFGTSAVPQGRAISGTKQLPPLAFRQYAVNLREVPATAKLTAPFSFWNRGKHEIEITKLEPSCGCLAPKLLGNRKKYGPGGQGLFDVQVETARETPGPHTYTIRVHYTEEGRPFEELVTFRCHIPERIVTVSPPELYFYQLSGKPLTSEIRVEDRRGKQLQVLDVTANTPYLTMSVGPREQPDSELSVTPIQIEVAGEVPPGAQTRFITIFTNDEDYPRIRVPVFLQGRPKKVQLTSGLVPASPMQDREAVQNKETVQNRGAVQNRETVVPASESKTAP